jgi:hypothetical protein
MKVADEIDGKTFRQSQFASFAIPSVTGGRC